MPITFRIDAALGIVRVSAADAVTSDDIRTARHAMLTDPEFGSGMNVLVDATAVDTSLLTREGLEALANDWKTILPPGGTVRFAIMTEAPAAFGLARMYEALTEETPLIARAFREEKDAIAWLQETAVPRR